MLSSVVRYGGAYFPMCFSQAVQVAVYNFVSHRVHKGKATMLG